MAVFTLRTDNAEELVHRLRARLNDYSRRRARQAGWTRRFVPTGLTPLDAVLPHGGLPCGAITEIFSDAPGVGAMSLVVRIASRCGPNVDLKTDPTHRNQGIVVLIDTHRDFYPPAAWQHGLALDRLIVVRTVHRQDALWAMDQSLRCSAVAVVIASVSQLDQRHSRRLQLAAESSGGIGLLLRSYRQRIKSFAAIQILVESAPDHTQYATYWHTMGRARLCRITLLKVREGMPPKPLWVNLDHETGIVSIPSVPVDRPAVKRA